VIKATLSGTYDVTPNQKAKLQQACVGRAAAGAWVKRISNT